MEWNLCTFQCSILKEAHQKLEGNRAILNEIRDGKKGFFSLVTLQCAPLSCINPNFDLSNLEGKVYTGIATNLKYLDYNNLILPSFLTKMLLDSIFNTC